MSSWEALKRVQKTTTTQVAIQQVLSIDTEIISSTNQKKQKRKRTDLLVAVEKKSKRNEQIEIDEKRPKKKEKTYFDVSMDRVSDKVKERYLGLDCEMVGVGSSGKRSALARCALVSFDGEVVYDNYVRPQAFVTDFRTKYSGIRQKDLRTGKAILFADCQRDVAALIKDKILVGHALKNDLDVLMLSHPHTRMRDTATYRPYMRPHPRKKGHFKPRALKDICKQHLGTTIQSGEHDPAEDARSAMFLFRRCRKEWEEERKDRLGKAASRGPTEAPAVFSDEGLSLRDLDRSTQESKQAALQDEE